MDWQLRPARDLGLAPGDRLRSLRRERGLFGMAASGLWRRLLRLYFRLFHRLEVEGRENLPAAPFVLIGNHTSHLDALVLASILRGDVARRAHALAAGEVFFGSGAGAVLSAYAINAFPIWRGKTKRGEMAALRTRLVEDGLVYILFPEGTRSRTGELGEFQPGLAMLLAGTGVPVVPCFIEGAFEAWPATRKWPRPGKVRVRIGAPVSMEGDRAAAMAACRSAVVALDR
ncbi:lysophospholipid acyltransferase family protein [Roseomonas sp. AR75]|uniref:lysophospholipid acyltransferase family protein n=1 Tax=Roseomonas sp. AR75 TaxID=2562311 RepID=UPI0010C156E8|nr:lysophospholipid acyltransferase family protein [Roseomonas sp. AR75]